MPKGSKHKRNQGDHRGKGRTAQDILLILLRKNTDMSTREIVSETKSLLNLRNNKNVRLHLTKLVKQGLIQAVKVDGKDTIWRVKTGLDSLKKYWYFSNQADNPKLKEKLLSTKYFQTEITDNLVEIQCRQALLKMVHDINTKSNQIKDFKLAPSVLALLEKLISQGCLDFIILGGKQQFNPHPDFTPLAWFKRSETSIILKSSPKTMDFFLSIENYPKIWKEHIWSIEKDILLALHAEEILEEKDGEIHFTDSNDEKLKKVKDYLLIAEKHYSFHPSLLHRVLHSLFMTDIVEDSILNTSMSNQYVNNFLGMQTTPLKLPKRSRGKAI